MDQATLYAIGSVVTVFGSVGGAWAGVRASLNGQRQQIRDTRDGVIRLEDKVDRVVTDHGTRIAKLEAWNDVP